MMTMPRVYDASHRTPFDNPPSRPQVEYLRGLLASRDHDFEIADVLAAEQSGRNCSLAIDKLKLLPYRPRAGAGASAAPKDTPDVPAGRYALMVPGGEDTDGEPVARFFQVDRPKDDSKWAGFTFVSALHAAGRSGYRKIPVKGQPGRDVLAQIAKDAQASMRAYGKLLGQCGNCNLPLTDPESIAFGIGPVCRSNLGW